MTEITNPLPDDPSGASTMNEDSTPVNGSQQLLDGASTGTDEGPAGIPASLAGEDKDGDDVPPPPAARPGDAAANAGSPETASPQRTSSGRSESAAGRELPASHDGR